MEKWKQVGSISAQALEFGITLIKKGATALEVVEKVDEKIRQSLRCLIVSNKYRSMKSRHTTALTQETVLQDRVVKLDVGASCEGFLGHTAATVDLSGNNGELVAAWTKTILSALLSQAQRYASVA